ncbi:MAG TPA: SAM-dependent methyltransferase [Polyangiaceae bacterium]|jgi:methyltransferase (TIGR00027 family)|nr:SAM-dependent methyltransferase [Polyangiaceae bacterium]
MSSEIEHVSDTAYWVAAYRALESERPDAVFHDRLASLLVGERGRAIERQMPGRKLMSFVMVVRTSAIDRLILHALDRGVDAVLNLGAGLDTRPYRMALPNALHWVEADFPATIAHKNEKLANEAPVCKLERVALDLSMRAERQALLKRVAENSRKVLLLTEGVIPYLKDDEVERLAEDIVAEPKFEFWIQDYYTAEARRHRPSWRKKLKAAPFQFSAPDWFGFFARFGFRPLEQITIGEEAARIRRAPPPPLSFFFRLLPRKWRARAGSRVGYALLERVPDKK